MELKNLSFEAWIQHIFDHPVTDPVWYVESNRDYWKTSSSETVAVSYMTKLFENAPVLCAPYSDAQLKQGFWFLIEATLSPHTPALVSDRVPLNIRLQCMHSTYTLFEQFFALKCSPHLSHLDEPGANKINILVYMWWDIWSFYGQPKQIHKSTIDVLGQILLLPSDACRESALHGLGHRLSHNPQLVRPLIGKFLKTTPKLRPKLRQYALAAMVGNVR